MRQPGIVLWQQLADQLAEDIAAGTFPAAERLPPEPALASRFGVNRHTLRRAVAELAERGLVSIEQGRGTFVRGAAVRYAIGKRPRFTEIVKAQDLAPTIKVIRTAEVAAAGRVAENLALEPGAPCLLIEALRIVDATPLALSSHYFPKQRFPGLISAFKEAGSVTQALRLLGLTDYTRKVTRVVTRLPTAPEARLLEQSKSTPVLITEAVNIDAQGRPVEHGVSRSAGDRIELVFES